MEGLSASQRKLVRRLRLSTRTSWLFLLVPIQIFFAVRLDDGGKIVSVVILGLVVAGLFGFRNWWYRKRWLPERPEIIERLGRDELLALGRVDGGFPARWFERLLEFPSPEGTQTEAERVAFVGNVDSARLGGTISPDFARQVVEWHEGHQAATVAMRR